MCACRWQRQGHAHVKINILTVKLLEMDQNQSELRDKTATQRSNHVPDARLQRH